MRAYPRWIFAFALVATPLELAWTLIWHSPMGGQYATALFAATVMLLLCIRRARQISLESKFWRRMVAGAVVMAVLVSVSAILTVLFGATNGVLVPVLWAPVCAFPFFYGGMVGWHRYATSVADPNDTINGISSVLVVLALVNVAMHHLDHTLTAGPWWLVQPMLAQVACLFILFGTSVSVAFVAAMKRDPRVWLFAAGFAAMLLGGLEAVIDGLPSFEWYGPFWAVGFTCLCVAAALPSHAPDPQPADPIASIIGAFVIMVASLAVLGLNTLISTEPEAVALAVLAGTGASMRLLINVRDLAQLAISRREALTDELTGLANRRALLRKLADLCEEDVPLALAVLDLDKFKEINSGLGHAGGDELLQLVARRLQRILGAGEILGRLGGDEFAVIDGSKRAGKLDTHERAAALGARLREALVAPMFVGELRIHVSASIGVTATVPLESLDVATRGPSSALGPAELLQEADTAMFDAKRSRRSLVVYDDGLHKGGVGQLALVEELRMAISHDQLVLQYQPQINIDTDEVVGVEALVRWLHPRHGLLSPDKFLPLAELHNLMGDLTDQVLVLAMRQAATWTRSGIHLRMSVNLSASDLLDTRLPERIGELLHLYQVPPTAIVLEVTESVLMGDFDRGRSVVDALAAMGMTMSIDDFGTGYASLTYLRKLPVGELKLDQSFTADLLTDPRAGAIVSSTIELAHLLGLRVVAEGVEDAETLLRLQGLHCDESQGFFHARPLAPAALEEWLRQRHSGVQTPRTFDRHIGDRPRFVDRFTGHRPDAQTPGGVSPSRVPSLPLVVRSGIAPFRRPNPSPS